MQQKAPPNDVVFKAEFGLNGPISNDHSRSEKLMPLLGDYSSLEITASLQSPGHARLVLVRNFKGLRVIVDDLAGCKDTEHRLRADGISSHDTFLVINTVTAAGVIVRFTHKKP